MSETSARGRSTPGRPRAAGRRRVRRRRVPRGGVLVIAAWPPELARLRALLARSRRRARAALAAVGVGLVEAALGTAAAIARHRPARVILVGTAGVYARAAARLRIGSVVEAREARLVSLSAVRGHAYLPGPLPAAQRLARPRRREPALPRVVVACPVAITRAAVAARSLAAAAAADAENLEAFAAARAAAAARVPLTILLGISNVVGPGAHRAWKRHGAAAAAAACEAAFALLPRGPRARARSPLP